MGARKEEKAERESEIIDFEFDRKERRRGENCGCHKNQVLDVKK